MRKTKRETAEMLAKAHFNVEPNLRRVIILDPLNESDAVTPIALLEVVDGTIERGIEPIAFAADPARGVGYPLLIVEVSPKEFADINSKKLNISNHGWTIGQELYA